MWSASSFATVGDVPWAWFGCSVGHYHRRRNVLLPVHEADGAEKVRSKPKSRARTDGNGGNGADRLLRFRTDSVVTTLMVYSINSGLTTR